jgi:eukaryotic-like serine/threonine-protein kinase
MTSGPPTGTRYRFGIFVANVDTGELLRKGAPVKLQDQPFQLLTLLLEHPAEIVSRESVRQRLWPADTFVEFDASLSVAVRKLRDALDDDADSPRFVETVPKKGYRFIAPVERLSDSQAGAPSAIASAAHAPSPSANLWRFALLAAVTLIGVAVFVLRSHRKPLAAATISTANAATPVRAPFRRSVAVLGFRNLPGRPDEDWLSQAFTEMLNTELAAGGNLRMVSDEDVASARRDLPLANQDSLARATLARIREKFGADVVLLGSYTPLTAKTGNTRRIRLDLRLQDTFNGETIAEDAIVGDEQDLFELAASAGTNLRKSLGINSLSPDDAGTVRTSLPSNATAIRFYSQGTAKLWNFDSVGARTELTKAVAADPNFPLAHSALSDAWWHLGYSQKASEEAKRALELSQHLTREEQLLVTGQFQRSIPDWPKAIETYRALFALRPDSLDYGLRLAAVQLHAKPSDALETLKTLRNFPPPWSDDPGIDLLEASAQIDQDFAKARVAARRAVSKGTAQGSHLVVARAYGILCQQGSSVGASTEDFDYDCEQARQSYAAAGDRNNEARTLNDSAYLHFQRGELSQAEKMWRAAAREFHQVDDLEGNAATSNNLGVTVFLEGNPEEGRKLLKESAPNYEAMEDQDGLSLLSSDLGDVSREEGDLDDAERQYGHAKSIATEIDDKSAQAIALFGEASLQKERGNFSEAQKSYEEALKLRTEIGEEQSAAETRLALAQLSLEQHHAEEAESQARQCEEQFHRGRQADDELAAGIALIQALQSQGKNPQAREEADRMRSLAAKSENRLVRLQFAVAYARTETTLGHTEASRRQLEQAVKDARNRHFLRVELDARLAVAQLNRQSGDTTVAKAQLASLQTDARKHGFTLVAQKAASTTP